MFNNLIGKNKELGRFLFCERYTLPPVKNAMYIAEGQELKRGAVVDVNGVLVGTNSLMPYAVLEFDCDTCDGGKEASVFVKGEFNFDKLHFASGLSKSDLDNIVYNGSGLGIVIKPYEYAEGFSPLMVPAGTSQSNPLMTAEETERMIDAMKPIEAMTLRFEFSKKDYNPNTAGVGSAGTWTKIDSPTLNIWDWTNTNTDWHESFKGAFPDVDNEVSVIATGDTSSVTNFKALFMGLTNNVNPSGSSYVLTSRNNIVSCVPFDISGCTSGDINAATLRDIFLATALKKYIQFNFSENQYEVFQSVFADTFIEEVGDVYLQGVIINSVFSRCSKLKKVGNVTYKLKEGSTYALNIFANSSANDAPLEEVGNLQGNAKQFTTLFQQCRHLKKIGSIDCSNATSTASMFSGCKTLEELPELVNIGNTDITDVSSMFNNCYKIKKIPLFDTSHSTTIRNMIRSCYELESIPNYNFDSVTNAERFAMDSTKVKEGITESYNKLLARGSAITNHTECFKNCGIDTPEGRAALAQIPASWGGLAEE